MRQPPKLAAKAAAGKTFVWVGQSGATWASPADWLDTKTGAVNQSTPHADDTVVVNSGTSGTEINGGGGARQVTLDGAVYLGGGIYNFGTLLSNGLTDIQDGTVRAQKVSASNLEATGSLDVSGLLRVTGSLNLGTGSLVRAGTLQLAGGAVSVGAAARLEVGGAGTGAYGVVTVDEGATMSGHGQINVDVANDGLIRAGGVLIMNTLSGSGVLRIAVRSEIGLAGVAAGTTIDFAGTGSLLDVTLGGTIAAGATIAGFAAGDAIRFDTIDVAAMSRVSTAGDTVLTLSSAAGQIVEQLTLAGSDAELDFALVRTSGLPGGITLVAVPAENSSGTAANGGGDHYAWTGHAGTAWTDAASWVDDSHPGSGTVPGSLDSATITGRKTGFTILTGTGDAARVTVGGTVAFAGSFDFGTLDMPLYTATEFVGPRTVVQVRKLDTLDGNVAVGGGATLDVTAASGGSYDISDGAALLVAQSLQNGLLVVDATASIVIGGTAGNAGEVTIAAGGTAENISTADTLLDNGRLVYTTNFDTLDVVGGSGSLVLHDGVLGVNGALSGVTVDFVGTSELIIGTLFYSVLPPVSVTGLQISGLGVTGTIDVSQGSTAESFLEYVPQGDDGGMLDLVTASGSLLDSFALSGKYTTDDFLLTQYGTNDVITGLPLRTDHQVSPGTPSGAVLQWRSVAQLGASWDQAANWVTVGGHSTSVAPGASDTAVLGQTGEPSHVFVTGAASVQDLEVVSASTLDGAFTAASAEIIDLALVGAGSSLRVGSLTADGYTGSSTLLIDRAQALIDNGDLLGGAALRDGGFLSAANLYLGGVSLDPTSRVFVGKDDENPAALLAGALTVEAGSTLQAAGVLQAGLVNDGVVAVAASTEVTGSVSGRGAFYIGSNGPGTKLVLDGSISTATQFNFVAGSSTIAFAQVDGSHGSVNDFTVGDTIDFTAILNAAQVAFQATGAAGGNLVIEDQDSHPLASLSLLGDYRGALFALSDSATAGAVITLTAFRS